MATTAMPTPFPTSFPSVSEAFIASQRANAVDEIKEEEPKEEPWEQNLNEYFYCQDCREFPPNLTEEFSSGDVVCASCGLVLGDRIIDTRSEWRTFANDDQNNDDPSRVGDSVNPLLNGSQLETSIAREGRDARDLQRAQNKIMKDNKNNKSNNQTLLAAYREITTYCDALNIPKTVQDAAKHIFKMTEDAKLFKGKAQEVVISGCIFIACRQANVPRTFREVFSLTRVPKKEIGKTFKQLEKFLQDDKNKHLVRPMDNGNPVPIINATNATELCERFCAGLRFSNNHLMARISSQLCEKSSAVKDLAGRSPLSVAAACIYMASHLMGEGKTSRSIAAIAGVSDGTIKTAYKFLYQAREELVGKEWLAKGGRLDRLPVN
ncbi:cyclin-like protein [Xylariaceae sp. FL0594]|nr:cyclin-like protein [Xylariaceae sp. FL0594]